MKLIFFIVLSLIVTSNAFKLSRTCDCRAVSNTLHVKFHHWEISSCKLCSCKDPAIVNCEQSCRAMVENYAKGGCGLVYKGSKVLYKWEASSCSTGISTEEFTCA